MIRAIRFELIKPTSESWETAGPTLRNIAKASPILLKAAMDSRIAMDIVGKDLVKSKIAPDAKAASPDGIMYQAVLRKITDLQEWGKKKKVPFEHLDVPAGICAAFSRAAAQAFGNRSKERITFSSELIMVRKQEVSFSKDDLGLKLTLLLRSAEGSKRTGLPNKIDFALAASKGQHRDIMHKLANGKLPHGDCKLVWDKRKSKWYALVSYEIEPKELGLDKNRTLVVHRGIRNALTFLTTEQNFKTISGTKYGAVRKQLQARMKDRRTVAQHELGDGAKGHGRARRSERYTELEGKLRRCTDTFCQQLAASVAHYAQLWGCGRVVIEDYGGIQPSDDPALRRILDRFPLYQMKQSIASCLERHGLELTETSSEYISSRCPRCQDTNERNHSRHTGMFRCRGCAFERPADWVAAYWMLRNSESDMKKFDKAFAAEKKLAKMMRNAK